MQVVSRRKMAHELVLFFTEKHSDASICEGRRQNLKCFKSKGSYLSLAFNSSKTCMFSEGSLCLKNLTKMEKPKSFS